MSPPELIGDVAAVYATRAWHHTEGDPIVPDPRDPRPDCERYGCAPAMGWAAWTHTDDCKLAFAAAQHGTWPARPTGEAPEHRAARQRTGDEQAALGLATDTQPDDVRPAGIALVRVVLERLGSGHSYGGGVNGTCYECPFASVPLDRFGTVAPWSDIYNDPTEAYFRCHLPGRTDEVVWGEYAPCSQDEWVNAALDALNSAEPSVAGAGGVVR